MKIDFVSKRIEISNAERKRAQNYGSREYAMLIQAMKELPNFQVTVQKPRTSYNPFARLTYEMMEHYIETSAPDRMEEFMTIRTCSRHYAYVKQWFLAQFPDANSNPRFAA